MRLRSRIPPTSGHSPLYRHASAPTNSPPSTGKRKSSGAKSRRKGVVGGTGRKAACSTTAVKKSVVSSSTKKIQKQNSDQSLTDDVFEQTMEEKHGQKRVSRKRKTRRFQSFDIESDKENSPVTMGTPKMFNDCPSEKRYDDERRRRFFSDPTRCTLALNNGSSPIRTPPQTSKHSGDKENVRPAGGAILHRRSTTQSPQFGRISTPNGRQILTPRRSITMSPVNRKIWSESKHTVQYQPLCKDLETPSKPSVSDKPKKTDGAKSIAEDNKIIKHVSVAPTLASSDAKVASSSQKVASSDSVASGESQVGSMDSKVASSPLGSSVSQNYAQKLSSCTTVIPRKQESQNLNNIQQSTGDNFQPQTASTSACVSRNTMNTVGGTSTTLTSSSTQATVMVVCCCQTHSQSKCTRPPQVTPNTPQITCNTGTVTTWSTTPMVSSKVESRLLDRRPAEKRTHPLPVTSRTIKQNLSTLGDNTLMSNIPETPATPRLMPIVLLHPAGSPSRTAINYHAKYLDLLLDHEVAQYTFHQVATLSGVEPRAGGAKNPVASFIQDADERHFRPIHIPKRTVKSLQGSAFCSIRYC